VEEEMDRVDLEHGRLARGGSGSYASALFLSGPWPVSEQLDLWTRFFPRKQLYIETAERFSREPQIVCSGIFNFLELSPFVVSAAIRHHTSTYDPMSESDQIWLADLFRGSNSKLADSYGVNIDEWV
jgi:hypothetical protein